MCLDTEGCASNDNLGRSKLLFEAKEHQQQSVNTYLNVLKFYNNNTSYRFNV